MTTRPDHATAPSDRAAAAERPRAPRLSDVSLSTVAAGFLAVLVSYSGPLLLYFEAARAMEVPLSAFSSWVFAISMAAGLSSIGLSLWLRAPIVTAWSAPGTALLISIGTGLPFDQIVGAFLVSAAAIFAIGASGLFDRAVALIPAQVADGMMAGILFGFGVKAMGGLGAAPELFAALLCAYAVFSTAAPRLALVLLAALAVGLSLWTGGPGEGAGAVTLAFAAPQLTWPSFSAPAIVGLGLPLVLTTLTGQFLPGMAILRGYGYRVPARPIVMVAAGLSAVGALLGAVNTALAAITAAICAGPEAEPDRDKRWAAAAVNGVFYCIGGIFAGSVVQLLASVPATVITMLAGLALLNAVTGGLRKVFGGEGAVLPGLLAFMVTVSGVSLWDIGSAFWGVVVGVAALHLQRLGAAINRRIAG